MTQSVSRPFDPGASRSRWSAVCAVVAALMVSASMAVAAPGGEPGKPDKSNGSSAQKVQGPSSTVSGTVTNAYSGSGVGEALLTFATLTATFETTTDANGDYSLKVPANSYYDITIAATNYDTFSTAGSLIKGKNNTLDAELTPIAPVVVTADASGSAEPDATLTLDGSCMPMDGSAILGQEWVQTEGTLAVIDDFMQASTTVTLASLSAYKDDLIHQLKEPVITEDQLPPNVPPPEGEAVGSLRDERTQVVAIVPYTLERAAHVGLEFVCETSSGVYAAPVNLATSLPWPVTTGLRTVPKNVPVLLYTSQDASYNWTIASQPVDSSATLVDSDTQTPWFTPDATGVYKIQETVSGDTLTVHSGLWRGVIDPLLTQLSVQFGDGLPVGDENCTGCHDGSPAPDAFTPWRETGHAHAFSDGLNANSHFSDRCFACHAVGVNFDAENAGMDDTPSYDAFVNSGLLNNPDPYNWLEMLIDYDNTARLANIQCENCHGPQSYTEAHGGKPGSPRVSIASEVCASCHGEPARHGRYQQWQLSRHANYELAMDEGDSGNCSRCHTGNGFIAWNKEFGNDPDENVTVTWEPEEVHSQTCAACHGPHETGTVSGSNPVAGVRIDGDTPMLAAGFQLLNVGKGALCMTCHNSRRGLRNDSNWDTTSDKDRAPHGPTQTDLLAAQNAYFVEIGTELNHRTIPPDENGGGGTCVACHMEKTPPPDLLSYNQSGTNHTFFAGNDVCGSCHDNIPTADGVQGTTDGYLTQLKSLIEAEYVSLMQGLVSGGASLDLDGEAKITSADQIEGVTLSESRGRQTIDVDVAGLTDPIRVGLGDVAIDGGPDDGKTLYDLSDVLMRATWNYHLVGNDSGLGVHNPPFSYAALQGAIDAVNAL